MPIVVDYLTSIEIIRFAASSRWCKRLVLQSQYPPPLCADLDFALAIAKLTTRYRGYITPYQLRAMCSIHPEFLRTVLIEYDRLSMTGDHKSRCFMPEADRAIVGCDILVSIVDNQPKLAKFFVRWFNPILYSSIWESRNVITILRLLHRYQRRETLIEMMRTRRLVLGTRILDPYRYWDRSDIAPESMSIVRTCCDRFLRHPFPITSDEELFTLDWAKGSLGKDSKLIRDARRCGVLSHEGYVYLGLAIETTSPVPRAMIDSSISILDSHMFTPTQITLAAMRRRSRFSTSESIPDRAIALLRTRLSLDIEGDRTYRPHDFDLCHRVCHCVYPELYGRERLSNDWTNERSPTRD